MDKKEEKKKINHICKANNRTRAIGASRQDSVQDKNSPRKQPSALPAKPTEIGTMEKGNVKTKTAKKSISLAHTRNACLMRGPKRCCPGLFFSSLMLFCAAVCWSFCLRWKLLRLLRS